MKNFSKSIALVLFFALSLVGCTTTPTTTNGTTTAGTTAAVETTTATTQGTPETTTAAEAVTAEETVYPLEVTSADGTTVTLESEPQRIVSISPTFTEVLFALGVGDRVVGRTDYCDYPAETQNIASIGSMVTPSVEKIVEMEPDLVLVSFMEQEMLDKVEESGAKVIQIPSSDSIEGSYAGMEKIGEIVNANEEAAKLVETIKTDIATIVEKVKDQEPVTAYYVAGFGKNGDYTAGANTFMNDLIVAAGGDNVAKDAEGWSYTAEKLLEKDPQYIFIGSMSQMTDDFKATEPYNNLTAVKEDQLVELDDNIISREGPRMAEAVEAIAKALHSEMFD